MAKKSQKTEEEVYEEYEAARKAQPTPDKFARAEILHLLEGLNYEGRPTTNILVESPLEFPTAMRQLLCLEKGIDPNKASKKEEALLKKELAELNPFSCTCPFWGLAYRDYQTHIGNILPDGFGDYMFLPLFKAGVGFYVSFCDYGIAVMMPSIILDSQARLHNAFGPAKKWGAHEEYYWEGTKVPKHWIMDKESMSAKEVLTEQNADLRTVGANLLGWNKIIEECKGTLIQQDKYGQLIDVDLPGASRTRLLRGMCGTGREIALPVPNTCKTAHEAAAWSYNVPVEEYNPEGRT